jgi:phosphoserine phosphatase
MATKPKPRTRRRQIVRLSAPGWNEPTRRALEGLIQRGAGQGLPVVFDFDNTIIQGDIGEAVLAQLAATGKLVPAQIAEGISPSLARPRGGSFGLRDCRTITEYYERFLHPTAHGADDPAPLANGYAWAVQAMAGLRLADVVEATQAVLTMSRQAEGSGIQPAPGMKAFPVPRFHPEMVELIATLLSHSFVVWIVSASNIWSVRWLTLQALNPLLAELGAGTGVAAERVIGVATLLADERGRLFKDAILTNRNPQHARLADAATSRLRLTTQLQHPLPAYSGKVACILDHIGRPPYLCAGDGSGDVAMLKFSQHRLWIARWRQTGRRTTTTQPPAGATGWLVQVTRDGAAGGFVPAQLPAALPRR